MVSLWSGGCWSHTLSYTCSFCVCLTNFNLHHPVTPSRLESVKEEIISNVCLPGIYTASTPHMVKRSQFTVLSPSPSCPWHSCCSESDIRALETVSLSPSLSINSPPPSSACNHQLRIPFLNIDIT